MLFEQGVSDSAQGTGLYRKFCLLFFKTFKTDQHFYYFESSLQLLDSEEYVVIETVLQAEQLQCHFDLSTNGGRELR